MLPKKNRINKKEIEEIFKLGKFINSPNLSFKFLFKKENHLSKISFVCPKSIARKAVKRNLLRRRGYSALSECNKKIPGGIMGVFIFKKYQDNKSELKNEIENILRKIN